MIHITCRLTAKNQDQFRNPTLGNRVWASFFYPGCSSDRKLCNFNRGKPAYKVLDVTTVNVCNQLLDSQYMHDVDFWGISLGCVEACSQHVNCSCVVNKALVAGKRPLKKRQHSSDIGWTCCKHITL